METHRALERLLNHVVTIGPTSNFATNASVVVAASASSYAVESTSEVNTNVSAIIGD